ncbi:MAG TPA: NAD(P)-binding domain-containing protein [Pirellulales bacterium]|jgi:cation diffusion facilitator CzcD-associated flavoprotein CzcO|nr:NAD(P)-binding domain-containing protein [Pirellulales bacterium]
MSIVDRTDRYCVIGAGSSGLTAAKNLLQAGIACDLLEKNSQLGGTWCYGQPGSSVYRSTSLISSKRLTEFTDFPIPVEYPPFLRHEQAWAYLRAYAEKFELLDQIEFNQPVQEVAPEQLVPGAAPPWRVALASGEVRRYRGVIIANGHNWDPKWPQLPGSFAGQTLHSAEYKTPDILAGKRVLVVGGGNSGCDIAVEAAQHAAMTFQSIRRGYHYLPKFLYGVPIDVVGETLLRWRFPLFLRRLIAGRGMRITLGRPEAFGLPKPDHRFLETHPVINSQMLYYVGHGRITPKPDVAELFADGVQFRDGTREQIDLIVFATGFKLSFPFIARRWLNWRGERPELFLHVFHPQFDNLFLAGLIQPDSGQWGLVDYQSQLIARFIQAQAQQPRAADRFRRRKATSGVGLARPIRYVESARHLLEIEHFSYRRRLQKLLRQFA